MYIKQFDDWHPVKKRIEQEQRKVHIRASEVRWCAIGVNIGSEIDGKGSSFTRPVVIVSVVGSLLALVVPLSTQTKERPGYSPFIFKDRKVSLCINQVKIVSQKRLLNRLGRVSDTKLTEVKRLVRQFFLL